MWLRLIGIFLIIQGTIITSFDYCHLRNGRHEMHPDDYTNVTVSLHKRSIDPTFRGNPKTREEIWHRNFNINSTLFDQVPSLIKLLNKVAIQYLNSCIPVILYDTFVQNSDSIILQKLFQTFPMSYFHGRINSNYSVERRELLEPQDSKCRNYILFLADALMTRRVLGPQIRNRVIVIARSTQWKLQEFLSSPLSRDIVNLLVIGESYSSDMSRERPFVLYTHQLYVDGLGANRPIVLTTWLRGRLSRPHVNLFPTKLRKGFSGHRFAVAAADQPPFVFKKKSTDGVGNVNIAWEGLEIRLLNTMKDILNFTIDIIEPRTDKLSSGDGVIQEVYKGIADIGIAGTYVTTYRLEKVEMTIPHTRDCASFITLTSKALPRYRAIMGPFQYPVWIALIFTYLIAIFPLAFSDRLTLSHLIGNAGEVENMFWYVFGTFTNCFTFSGKYSWSNTKKNSTRMLIGWYWLFTIIITACYTGSIIAFVTLPIFPSTVDSINQLINGFYRIGTLEKGGWEYWFSNSTHKQTQRLLKDLEYVADVEEGLNNVTKAFFWSYAFLGSKSQLEYIVQANFTDESFSKRSALHISNECFGLFYSAFAMPQNSVYTDSFNELILMMAQSGLIEKLLSEVSWVMQRSSTGRLLQAGTGRTLRPTSVEERGLTLADTEGMFLLLGIGFLLGTAALISEWIGGCTKKCKEIIIRRRDEKQFEAEHIQDIDGSAKSGQRSYHPNSLKKSQRTKTNDKVYDVKENFDSSAPPSAGDDPMADHQSVSSKPDSRKTSVSLQNVPPQTEASVTGHRRRHSAVVIIKNADTVVTCETDNQVTKLFDYLDDNESQMTTEDNQTEVITEIHKVEINRPPTPYTCPQNSIEEIVEDVFGEKVSNDEDGPVEI